MSEPHKFSNKEVILILKEALAAMEVKGFNLFKIRAYQNAITTIESLSMSVFNLWENKRLGEIQGVGAALESHLDELFRTGKVVEFDAIKNDLPQGMFALMGLRGIGAKKSFKLASLFNLVDRATALAQIKEAAEQGKIQVIEGFGEKSEKLILEAVSDSKKTKNEKSRTLLSRAEQVAMRILQYLEGLPEIETVDAVGSFRRRKSTVGDLEFAIATTNTDLATQYFLKFPEITEVLVSGKTRSSVVVGDDLQVDIRVFDPKVRGSMLQYFTGSKAHNVLLRTYSLESGLSISEYGIKKVSTGKVHEFKTEEDFYDFLNLQYIPPEIRQGKNEIELAKKQKLPRLITLKDIRGDIHTHTIASDGVNTLTEMANAAKELGYSYIGIADHAPSVQNRGFDEVKDIIQKTRKTIDEFNATQNDIKVLFGYEVNILADATLSLPDELLAMLDYAIASIHTSFTQDRETITKRLVAAIENPYINIIGHPSGRLINEREGCDANWTEVFIAAKDNDKILEINSQPNRLDLADDLVYEAVNRGLDLIINTDAHATDQLALIHYGIDVARQGWCESKNIINTLNYEDFVKALRKSDKRT